MIIVREVAFGKRLAGIFLYGSRGSFMSTVPRSASLTLQQTVTCPHCWKNFQPEDSLWIAEHPDVLGDPKLGPQFAKRFLPSRFTVEGDAHDEAGYRSSRLACPDCHLEVPRAFYQIAPIFFSILGAPACGKSYFLASMTWKMRQMLPSKFAVSMNDADAMANARLHEYEEQQFLNPDPEGLVAIEKTQVQGDLYDNVNMGDHTLILPRPFMFTMQPMTNHVHYKSSKSVSRVMCLYDNAGESFLPGQDSATSPVTRHLALSKTLFFLFDPTQDPRFRRACEGKSSDPQMTVRSARLAREASVRQDTILLEAINRVRRHAGLREDDLHQRPLTIVVTKWDSWEKLIPDLSNSDPYIDHAKLGSRIIDGARIQEASDKVGAMLRELTPEIVAGAEGFAKDLTFLPVSATGCSPEVDPTTGQLGVRPKDMSPYWVEVPVLYALSRWSKGLIGLADKKSN